MEEFSEESIARRINDISARMAARCQADTPSFFAFADCLAAVEQRMRNISYLPFYLEQVFEGCLARGGTQQVCEAETLARKQQALLEAYDTFKAYDAPLPQ